MEIHRGKNKAKKSRMQSYGSEKKQMDGLDKDLEIAPKRGHCVRWITEGICPARRDCPDAHLRERSGQELDRTYFAQPEICKRWRKYGVCSERPTCECAHNMKEQKGSEATNGTEIDLVSNAYPMKIEGSSKIHKYRVSFEHEVRGDGTLMIYDKKMKILASFRQKLSKKFGFYQTDTEQLWATKNPEDFTKQDRNAVRFEFRETVCLDDILNTQQSELILSRFLADILKKAGFTKMGCMFVENLLAESHDIIAGKVALIPGYATTINASSTGLQLHVALRYRLYDCSRTVGEMIRDDLRIYKRSKDMKQLIKDKYLGRIVLSLHNLMQYRIGDLDFETNIDDTFYRNGQLISYSQYFKDEHNLNDLGRNQAMIVCPRGRNAIRVPPGLCYLTIRTKDMKSHRNLQKQLFQKTNPVPRKRIVKTQNFINQAVKAAVKSNERVDEDAPFHLDLKRKPIETTGLVLPLAKALMPKGSDPVEVPSTQLNRHWKETGLFDTSVQRPHYPVWAILCEAKYESEATKLKLHIKDNTKEAVKHDARGKIRIRSFKPKPSSNDDGVVKAWKKGLKKLDRDEVEVVMCIYADDDNSSIIYRTISRILLCDKGIQKQCIKVETIRQRLGKIEPNLVNQIFSKLGFKPWIIKHPDKFVGEDVMMIGLDVNHDTKSRKSTVGFVSSYDGNFAEYLPQISYQSTSESVVYKEIICGEAITPMVVNALKKFLAENGRLPKTILLFRDGVSHGQMKQVYLHENKCLREAFKEFGDYYSPHLSTFVAQKSNNTRLYTHDKKTPPIGTVVDQKVVSAYGRDFFVFSTKSGNPVHWHVVANDGGFNADEINEVLNTLANLYFNWPGPVKLPAPLMHADKLAYIFGSVIDDDDAFPHELLEGLYWL